MITNPNIPETLEKIGVDKVVEIIKPFLMQVKYNYSVTENDICVEKELFFYDTKQTFGISEISEINKEPVIKKEGIDYHILFPNDNKKSVCFLYEHDERIVNNRFTIYQISLVTSFNHNLLIPNQKIDAVQTELFISKTIEALKKAIPHDYHVFNVFKEKKRIYEDFFTEPKRSYLKHPLDGFRIRFKISVQNICEPNYLIKIC